MQEVLESNGFKVIAAGAFIANHSIMRRVAAGRPDEKDIEIINKFGKNILEKISSIKNINNLNFMFFISQLIKCSTIFII